VILDGANRVSVARASELPHLLVQVIDYGDPAVKLGTWNHTLSGFPPERLEGELGRVPGLTLRQVDLGHARALLARREAIAYIVLGSGRALSLLGNHGLFERNALLNAVVDLYRDRVPVHRETRDSLIEARARFPDVTALVVFQGFRPDEILEIATSGERVPAGITRHVIRWRALRVNVALDFLADPAKSIEEKNRWLQGWLAERSIQRNIRFYEESTVLFDE
jgi:hypothetical protein